MLSFVAFLEQYDFDDHNTCVVHSIAHVMDVHPNEVWKHAKQYWKKNGGGIDSHYQHHILKALGHPTGLDNNTRFDLMKKDATDKHYQKQTLGNLAKQVANEPHKKFLISVKKHMLAAKHGKIFDPGTTGHKTKIHQVWEI